MVKRAIVFVLMLALFAFLAWVGGYNFDQRGFWPAYWAGHAIILSAIAAMLAS